MKITKIEIKNYHQFKNFSIDLTYPQGHSKAGKPLDKICFIGQSGTGKSTIILFDEVENSLYPDVQQELISYYTKIASEAQFFFATHSPIIASQFEPCERFILKFDKNNFIKAIRGKAPEGVTSNDILINDFNLENALMLKGQKMWDKYLKLRKKLILSKDEKEKKDLISQLNKIGQLYNFEN